MVDAQKIDRLAERMKKCRTEQEALAIAADWMVAHKIDTGSTFKVATLMSKFGDAMDLALDRIPMA